MTTWLDRGERVWRRVVARWIDLILVGWVAVVAVEAIDGAAGAVVGLVVLIGYEVVCTLRWSRTPGKMVTRVHLVAVDGVRVPWWSAVIRPAVLYGSFGLPFVWWIPIWAVAVTIGVGVLPGGRVLHDLAAATRVVR